MLISNFRAFDLHKKGLLGFREVLLGLAAMEPDTQHGGTPAEMRCRYIYRYYNKHATAALQFEDFKSEQSSESCRVIAVLYSRNI